MNAPTRLEKLRRARAELDELIAAEENAANDTAAPRTPKFMRKAEYAKRRGVSLRTIDRWVQLGLPRQKIGAVTNILVAEADAWSEPKAIARDAEVAAAGGGSR